MRRGGKAHHAAHEDNTSLGAHTDRHDQPHVLTCHPHTSHRESPSRPSHRSETPYGTPVTSLSPRKSKVPSALANEATEPATSLLDTPHPEPERISRPGTRHRMQRSSMPSVGVGQCHSATNKGTRAPGRAWRTRLALQVSLWHGRSGSVVPPDAAATGDYLPLRR